jgi:hypothetical protein
VLEALGEDRVEEIARMLGDADGAAARRHAAEMLAGPAPATRRSRSAR